MANRKTKESEGVTFKIYDVRNRLVFVTPIRRNAIEKINEMCGRTEDNLIQFVNYDTLMYNTFKIVVCAPK